MLPAALRLGPTHLTVSDLGGSISFYERSLGLRLRDRDGDVARLGTGGEDLLVLTGVHGAGLGGRHAGLYHVALLMDSREELARAITRLAESQTRIEGASDHGVSQSIYLRDPDDNGIELYADRPRDQWPAPRHPGERVDMFTIALDMQSLLATVADEPPSARARTGMRTGHLHLHVADLDGALGFYRDILGFEVMAGLPSASFLSAGGYHHHLGINTWLGTDVRPRPRMSAGLRHWTILLPGGTDVDAVRGRVEAAGLEAKPSEDGLLVEDPSQIAVLIAIDPDATR